jgi:hypothetical protein
MANFHKFHDVVNNVCQVCGRAASKIIADKQPQAQITSLNTPRNSSTLKGVSTEIDYKPLIEKDESKAEINLTDGRVQVNSFREAVRYIHESDKSPSMMRNRNVAQVDYLVGIQIILDNSIISRKLNEK